MSNSPPGLSADDIKFRLAQEGYTLLSLSEEIERDISTVSRVIRGRNTSAYIAAVIADIINVPVGEIWPRQYPELEAKHEEMTRHERKTTA